MVTKHLGTFTTCKLEKTDDTHNCSYKLHTQHFLQHHWSGTTSPVVVTRLRVKNPDPSPDSALSPQLIHCQSDRSKGYIGWCLSLASSFSKRKFSMMVFTALHILLLSALLLLQTSVVHVFLRH